MIVKKLLLIASAAALMSTPAWAGPGRPNHGTDHPTPNDTGNPGNHHGKKGAGNEGNNSSQKPNHPNKPSHPGQSHKCKPHNVAYVASGTLASQMLSKGANGRYSGVVTNLPPARSPATRSARAVAAQRLAAQRNRGRLRSSRPRLAPDRRFA